MSRLFRAVAGLALLPATFCITGCSTYSQTQVDLLDQTRRGIAMARSDQATFSKLVDQLGALQRKQLDDAFDADVRDQTSPPADWIIEHRRAYAAAIDAMDQQRFSLQQSAVVADGNFDAIDQALQRLRWLNEIPLSWLQQLTGGPPAKTTPAQP